MSNQITRDGWIIIPFQLASNSFQRKLDLFIFEIYWSMLDLCDINISQAIDDVAKKRWKHICHCVFCWTKINRAKTKSRGKSVTSKIPELQGSCLSSIFYVDAHYVYDEENRKKWWFLGIGSKSCLYFFSDQTIDETVAKLFGCWRTGKKDVKPA